MMENDDTLHDLFRQKNLENAFVPDEQNWQKMASVLREERQKRRLLIYWSLLLLIGGLGAAWYLLDAPATTGTQVAQTPAIIEQTLAPAMKSPAPVHQSAAPEQPQTALAQPPQPHTKPAAPALALQQPVKPAVKTVQDVVKPQLPFDSAQGDGATVSAAQPAPQPETTKTPLANTPVPPVSAPVAVVTPHEAATPSGTKTLAQPGEQAPGTTEKAPAGGDVPVAQTKTAPENNDAVPAEAAPGKTTEAPTQLMLEPEPVTAAPATDTLPAATPTVALAQPDSTAVIPDPSTDEPFYPNRLALEAGISYQLGWQTNGQTEAAGINPVVGLQFFHDLNRNLGFSFGMHYTAINHLSQTTHSSVATRLKFGAETDVTLISATSMHYLLLPLRFSYSLGSRDAISIGATMAYLLDVESRVEQYTTRTEYASAPVVSRAMGYKTGFNALDGQATVSYRRRFFKQWYVNGEFFYGLRDVKKDAVYSTIGFERAWGLRLSLGINLWKK